MTKGKMKEVSAAYLVSNKGFDIPTEWPWLKALDREELAKFYQEILNAVAQAKQQNDWLVIKDRIAVWRKRAEEAEKQDADMESAWDTLFASVEKNKVDTGLSDLAHHHDRYLYGTENEA